MRSEEDWTRAEALFHELIGLDPSARHVRLAEITAGDPSLGAELEGLVAAHDTPGVLDHLADEIATRFEEGLAHKTPPPGGLKGTPVSHYTIEDLIGRGGMGEVYRARDTRLDRLVALKFLPAWLSSDPAARDRFFVEARIVSSIQHTNVCGLHDIGETADERMYLVMPFYEGETLKSRLVRGPLSPDEVVTMGLQAARGLAAAHDRGIVHRDIKPGNLLLAREGQVKILDFGVAKLVDVDLTRTGQTPGTMSYMSPEQRAGRPIDARSDLWSLGAVLHEAVTGLRPVEGVRDDALTESAPRGLAEVVRRLLALSPADRYPDARSLADDLEVLAEGSDALRAVPVPKARRFLAELKRRHVFRVAAVYGVVGFGIIEAAGAIFPHMSLPGWAVTLIVWLVLLGLPVALVLAWNFEMSPDGVRRTHSVRPAILDAMARQPASRRWPIGIAGAVGGALVVIAAWIALGAPDITRPRLSLSDVGPPGGAAGVPVAVLPFRVIGAGVHPDVWHEGMVHLLSDDLESVDGLRGIDYQPLMHAWEERFGGGNAPDRESALEIARSLDARYAITGTAVEYERTVRLSAEVHDLERGASLGSTRMEAPTDSLTAIVNDLTLALLRDGLLPADTAQTVDLSRVSTNSFPAFREYLAGEWDYRRGRFREAAAHFTAAAEIDTTFARAMYRAAGAYVWTDQPHLSREYRRRAASFAHDLPTRDSLLFVSALGLYSSSASIPLLRRLTSLHPDDLDGWMQLGEAYYHHGGNLLYPTDSYRRAWGRALELGPLYAESYIHLIEDAFARRDRDRAHALLSAYADVDATGAPCPAYRLAYDAAWGEGRERAEAARLADTIDFEDLHCGWTTLAVADATTQAAEERSLEAIAAREGPREAMLFRALQARVMRGELSAARSLMSDRLDGLFDPRWAARYALQFHLTDFPNATAARAAAELLSSLSSIGDARVDEPREFLTFQPHANGFWLGALALEEGRDDAVAARVTELLTAADSLRVLARSDVEETGGQLLDAAGAESDSLLRADADEAEALAEALRLFAEFTRDPGGDLAGIEAVLKILPTTAWRASAFVRYRVGRELARRGELREAEHYLATFDPYAWPHYVAARYWLGYVHERLGRLDEAREDYRIFVEWWDAADPELQPFVEEGRAGLARVSGPPG